MKANTKIQDVNNFWNSFKNLTNADYRAWVKQLNELKTVLCGTQYWNELIENIETVKSNLV